MIKRPLSAVLPRPRTLEDAQQLITLLAAKVDELQDKVEALAEQYDNRIATASNSDKPPSSDGPAERAKRPSKAPSTRAKGAQPGHKGTKRLLHPPERVDQVHDWYPGNCPCGGLLEPDQHPPLLKQHIDLPPARFHVTEHRLHSAQCCQCGRQHRAQLPQHIPSSLLGPRLLAHIALLSGQFRVSNRQIQAYLHEIYDLTLSVGCINQAPGRVTPWLWMPLQKIRAYILQSPWVHADETVHYRKKTLRWMWVMVTAGAVYCQTHYSRGKGAAQSLLGEAFTGVLISDRHGA